MANTQYWQVLRQTLDAPISVPRSDRRAVAGAPPRMPLQLPSSATDQLARAAAAERALALALAALAGASVSPAEAQQASDRLRRENGLLSPEVTAQWMVKEGLSLEGLSRLAHERVLVERFAAAAKAATEEQLPSVLRSNVQAPPQQPAHAPDPQTRSRPR